MRTADVDILIVPGWSSSGDDHWQSRWQRSLKTARRVEQGEWIKPQRQPWVARILEEAGKAGDRPVILVAHSLGVAAAVHAAVEAPKGLITAGFFVAPADVEHADRWPVTRGETFDVAGSGFAPLPRVRLPFPSLLIASANDPYCSLDAARSMAESWGSELVEAGDAGHINVESGHGPWPEGLLRLGVLLKKLSEPAAPGTDAPPAAEAPATKASSTET